MPLVLANSCHFVKGLGLGTGFARGRVVVGAGKRTTIASSILSVGSSQILFSKSCVLSRVSFCKYSSLFDLKLKKSFVNFNTLPVYFVTKNKYPSNIYQEYKLTSITLHLNH